MNDNKVQTIPIKLNFTHVRSNVFYEETVKIGFLTTLRVNYKQNQLDESDTQKRKLYESTSYFKKD